MYHGEPRQTRITRPVFQIGMDRQTAGVLRQNAKEGETLSKTFGRLARKGARMDGDAVVPLEGISGPYVAIVVVEDPSLKKLVQDSRRRDTISIADAQGGAIETRQTETTPSAAKRLVLLGALAPHDASYNAPAPSGRVYDGPERFKES